MNEYSINSSIRNKINNASLIISILFCLAIQIIINNTVYVENENNAIFLYVILFVTPSVFTLMEILKQTFLKKLWKIPWINKLIGVPNLNGEWFAKGRSDYNSKKEFEGRICITQTLAKIKIEGHFGESKSINTHTYLEIDEDGSFELSYHYNNTPKVTKSETMHIHSGFMHLSKVDNDSLEGEYFNDRFRGTKGTMTLTRLNEKKCKENETTEKTN